MEPSKIEQATLSVSLGLYRFGTDEDRRWLEMLISSEVFCDDGTAKPQFDVSVHACPLVDDELEGFQGVPSLRIDCGAPSSRVYVDAFGGCHVRRGEAYVCVGALPIGAFVAAFSCEG
jgi:hypothetical protein